MKVIENQLSQLRLYGLKKSWTALLETRKNNELSLNEGLEILLQAELQDRVNRRFDRLRKTARFRYQASLEELMYDASRGLNKSLITTLSSGDYISNGESVLISSSKKTPVF